MSIVVQNAEDTSLTNHNDDLNVTEPAPKNIESTSLHNDLREKFTESFVDERIEPSSEDSSSGNDEKDDFPEGGIRGWSVVLGSFCGSFSVFGIINSTAIFQEYFSTHQLSQHSPSQIGWIFSLSLFLTFFCGVLIGPVFDSKGPRLLVLGGSVLLAASMMLLGLCTSM